MEFLTVKETAQLLRVSPITVRRYIASGQLAAERVGRGIRVRREAIEEFVTPVEPDELLGRPTTEDDPLWGIIGMATSESPNDVTSNKHKHRADFTAASWSDKSDEDAEKDGPRTILEGLGISVGIWRSGERTDVAEHKDENLADAYASETDDEDDPEPYDFEFEDDDLPTLREQMGNIFGIGRSSGPNDVSANKYKYLADAYESDRG